MEAKKILSPEAVKTAIIEKATVLKRKQELYESVQSIENELKVLNEAQILGGFGFANPQDVSNKTKTGFVNNFQNISNIARLEAEMAPKAAVANLAEEQLNELTRLKEEVEKLQKENTELKAGQTSQTK